MDIQGRKQGNQTISLPVGKVHDIVSLRSGDKPCCIEPAALLLHMAICNYSTGLGYPGRNGSQFSFFKFLGLQSLRQLLTEC